MRKPVVASRLPTVERYFSPETIAKINNQLQYPPVESARQSRRKE